jgi:ribonuclease Z
MKLFFYILGTLAVLLISGALLIQNFDVQDKLVQREITKRMSSTPDDLFAEDALRVTLCGSAAPMPIKGRAAACVMVFAGGKFYIVDTGNRSTNNLGLWRIPSKRVGAVLLTHFHSDHMGDLGEFNMMTWAQGRDAPLDVYGPVGVKQVVEGFTLAYALDSAYRTAHHGAKYLDPANGKMIAKEIALDGDSATVLDDGDLKVTMFAVNHAPIHPAVGYRFDYKGRSVVISGDTTKTETTIKYSKDADILFHEGLSRNIVKQMEVESGNTGNDQLEKIMFDIQDYHTSPVEAAEVANEANVTELVLYHLVPAPPNKVAEWVFMRGVNNVRSSGVTVGYDGLTYILPIDSKDIYQEDLNDRH